MASALYQGFSGFATFSPSPPSPARGGKGAPRRLQWPTGGHNSPPPRGPQLMQNPANSSDSWHGTTILTVRKGGTVAIGGDGQVSIGQTIVKANPQKMRRLGQGAGIGA